ncbi:MAG: MerR family transcriptional regulator [Candidatus Obscuribacterales bacterium]|nr:MerR family transcriptional regulator [Candidatus Obscuribacterales bacterium]
MRQKNKGEGTKIAQAAKDLNVTSVTIRRYISEFNIDTMSDENGIKVLPAQAMDELFEIRKLKEDGLTNPKVLETLEEKRAKLPPAEKPKSKEKAAPVEAVKEPVKKATRVTAARISKKVVEEVEAEESEEEPAPVVAEATAEEQEPVAAEGTGEAKSKYSLTCQTCNKTFEHMNPRLRDCLDCYRIKRKERRRGGSDKHKTVIQNPLAQQVLSKQAQSGRDNGAEQQPVEAISFVPAVEAPTRKISIREQLSFSASAGPQLFQSTKVRNYRKAIEDTRQITSNLKRRLERPDLPESERRFLEQIYAYQLILHQGWKHLAEYRSGGTGGSDSRPE